MTADPEGFFDRLRNASFTFRGQKITGYFTNDSHDKTIRISPVVLCDPGLFRACLYSFAQALGHPDPEEYRATDLEQPKTVGERVDAIADRTRYYARRAQRFLGEVGERIEAA